MKSGQTIYVTIILLLFAANVFATGPEYDSSRRWVEGHNPKDQTPITNRVFVAYSNTDTIIVRFKNGIMLRDIIDQTKFKGKKVGVIILRSGNKTTPVFDEVITPLGKPSFMVRADDMIWFTDVPSVRL